MTAVNGYRGCRMPDRTGWGIEVAGRHYDMVEDAGGRYISVDDLAEAVADMLAGGEELDQVAEVLRLVGTAQ